MPVRTLDWSTFGSNGVDVVSGTTVDTGGVAVTFDFNVEDEGAAARNFEFPQFVAPGESFDNTEGLKLFGAGGEGGIDDTSTSTISFAATGTDEFGDAVTDVSFRINDLDLGQGGENYQDIVTIRAYDADGNLVPVTLTPGADILVSGGTATGNDSNPAVTEPTNPDTSLLVEIAGPITRIEIDYDNCGDAEQNIWLTDVEFSTTPAVVDNEDPDAVDDAGSNPLVGGEVTVAVLDNDTDPDGDTLEVTGASDGANGTTVVNPDGTITYTPNDPTFLGTDTFTYDVSDGNGGTDTATVTITVGEPDGLVEGDDDPNLIDDMYTGDPEGDMIDANDQILPGEGENDDIVLAGGGNDTVISGDGDDDIFGGDGDDSIDGEEGNDIIRGEDGDDTIDGGEGNDTVFGGDGNDVIQTDSGEDDAIDAETFVGVPVDPDPDNDRDFVDGGAGDDTITNTGDDSDTVLGGTGNDVIDTGIDDDVIDGGAGNDSIIGGQGSDSIDGGAGDDTIIAGDDLFSDYVGDDPNLPNPLLIDPATGLPALSDPNTEDNRDTVDGGDGNDIIMTGDDADFVMGGAGNDTINAGIDDDSVVGQDGDDLIIGSHGSDTLRGGQGDDTIYGGFGTDPIPGTLGEEPDATDPVPENGQDSIIGGAGNDVIFGEDDDDTLLGGIGNDTIDGGVDDDSIRGQDGDDVLIGGQGNDTVQGGNGNDTISGGEGADDLQGRADADVFLDVGAGDTVDGGTGDTGGGDFDTLDLRGLGPFEIVGETVDADGDSTSGTVNFLDTDGNVTGTLEFLEIENLIPCFTPGTVIATPRGERRVEDLQVGDRIITRDNGLQEIRWVGKRTMTGQELLNAPHMQPVLIRAGSLGQGLPERDLLVSPQHRILMNSDRAALYFEEREVLAAAKHLTGLEGVDVVDSSSTTYVHFMFDQHEVVLSNGSWTESFQPGEQVMDGMGLEQRDEIYTLFPELREEGGLNSYQAARRSLKKHEAKLLVK
ncbi:Hint domain-containing protein [Roseovarius sp. 2305UL8-3]|uniref:Hint domain-containing protein n=1 Tax=Roseovarius conchicola TaxID=3121636 RepID=UPI003529AC0A